jgi:isochorismate hydrolase
MDPNREAYSGFDGTSLSSDLEKNDVERVFVGGLATDYCVKNTVLDGLALGFDVVLLLDASRGINAKPDDSEKAVEAMISRGAKTANLEDFPEPVEIPEPASETEGVYEKPVARADKKKKARLRSRGPYRKARIEH